MYVCSYVLYVRTLHILYTVCDVQLVQAGANIGL